MNAIKIYLWVEKLTRYSFLRICFWSLVLWIQVSLKNLIFRKGILSVIYIIV